jgi:hypothetical protein
MKKKQEAKKETLTKTESRRSNSFSVVQNATTHSENIVRHHWNTPTSEKNTH